MPVGNGVSQEDADTGGCTPRAFFFSPPSSLPTHGGDDRVGADDERGEKRTHSRFTLLRGDGRGVTT